MRRVATTSRFTLVPHGKVSLIKVHNCSRKTLIDSTGILFVIIGLKKIILFEAFQDNDTIQLEYWS